MSDAFLLIHVGAEPRCSRDVADELTVSESRWHTPSF